jgi:hypothetical protein
MPKKTDLSKAFGERFKTEQKVEVQNPFEVAINQPSQDESKPASTQAGTNALTPVREQESTQDSKHARMHARIEESTRECVDERTSEETQGSVPVSEPERKQVRRATPVPTRKQERIEVLEQAYISKGVEIDMLYDQIQQKKHLSNGSFRYRADELEKLDDIFKDLEAKKPGRISKNDIARMALIAFYQDYENNGEESILARVFKRM